MLSVRLPFLVDNTHALTLPHARTHRYWANFASTGNPNAAVEAVARVHHSAAPQDSGALPLWPDYRASGQIMAFFSASNITPVCGLCIASINLIWLACAFTRFIIIACGVCERIALVRLTGFALRCPPLYGTVKGTKSTIICPHSTVDCLEASHSLRVTR